MQVVSAGTDRQAALVLVLPQITKQAFSLLQSIYASKINVYCVYQALDIKHEAVALKKMNKRPHSHAASLQRQTVAQLSSFQHSVMCSVYQQCIGTHFLRGHYSNQSWDFHAFSHTVVHYTGLKCLLQAIKIRELGKDPFWTRYTWYISVLHISFFRIKAKFIQLAKFYSNLDIIWLTFVQLGRMHCRSLRQIVRSILGLFTSKVKALV